MDKRAVVESIMRNLDFDLETIPKHTTTQEKTTTSKNTDPLNIKIRVRKKDNERCSQGFMTNNLSEPEMILRKVRLVSSEKTIMSFEMFMEADLEDTTAAKPRKMFGSCLGAAEEDDGPYSKSDGKIRKQFPITKKTYDPFSGSNVPRRERTFLGQKCKPGGCLDPPFGEDRYAYMPHIQDPSHTQNIKKPHRLKPDKTDINNELVREQQIKSPIKEDHMHKDDSRRPSATRTPDPIINIYKTESPKSSLIMYPPYIERNVQEPKITSEKKQSKDYKKLPSEDKFRYPIVDHPIIPKPIVETEVDKDSKSKPMVEDKYKRPSVIESNVKKPRLTTEGDESNIIQNIRTSEDKSKYIISNDGKPPRSRVSSENKENKLYNNRSSTEEKYRQSVNESMNSFFSPPKGIRRESSQRDSLKRHSNIPITENKPLENLIPPVAGSVSLDSVPLEQNTESKYIGDTRIQDEKTPEQLIKYEPDQKLIEPQQMIPIIVPLPYPVDANQIDKNVISDNIDLSNQNLKKESTELQKPPELSTSSSVNITFPNDLVFEQIGETNDIILVNPILPLEPEPITKDQITLFEKTPSLANQSTESTDYGDHKEIVIETDKENKDIKPDDIIKKRNGQEKFEKIKEDDNQVIKDVSLNSITDSTDDVAEQTELTPKQDLQKNANIQNEQDTEILNKPNLAPQPQQEAIVKHEIPKTIYPPIKYPATSPKNVELHYETKPTEQLQKIESLSKNVDQPIKKDNDDNYNPDKVLISETIKPEHVIDKTLETISYIPNIPKSHSPTETPIETSTKDEIKVSKEAERPLVTDIKKSRITIPGHKTQETKDLTDNKYKILPPTTDLSDRDAHTVFLDLGFHSYLDNENKRVLKTLDSRYEVKRYPNDTMAIIKSPVQLPSETAHKFLIPIDSQHDMSIELKKRKHEIDLKDSSTEPKTIPILVQAKASNVKSKSEVKDSDQHQLNSIPKTNENEQVRSKLTHIYEQELVPLQDMIRSLKQEIDSLAAHHTVYKKKVVCLQASTIPRIMHSNKRCSLYHCNT